MVNEQSVNGERIRCLRVRCSRCLASSLGLIHIQNGQWSGVEGGHAETI